MVAAENWTSRRLVGWDQVLAARERIAVLSVPGAGGQLKSEPTTENRNRAHKAPVELGGIGVITTPHRWGERTLTIRFHRSRSVSKEHLLRIGGSHCETLISRPPATVIGERNRSRSSQSSQGGSGPRKALTSEWIRFLVSPRFWKPARATFQKSVCGKCSRQKVCQRMIVL